jgi:hypothetical protein
MYSHPEGVVFALADATYGNTYPDGPATTRSVAQGDRLRPAAAADSSPGSD